MSFRYLIIPLLCLFLQNEVIGQSPRVKHCIYLIGNIADIQHKETYGAHLRQLVESNRQARAIIFNGDFINPDKPFKQEYEGIYTLLDQLKDLPVRIIFIPGDRDWDDNGLNGLEMVQLIEDLVNNGQYLNVEWPLKNGCPGPKLISIAEDLKIIAINTQWWNHRYKKPTPETAICGIASDDAFFEEIEDMVDENVIGNLVIAGHFPMSSNGKYGGKFPLKDWLFPVPILSSMKTAYRQNIGYNYETVNERFEPFKEGMLDLFADHFSLIYSSGHEQNIEIIKDNHNVFINSGAPEFGGFVAKTRKTSFASKDPGIVSLFFDNDGAVYTLTHLYKKNGFVAGKESMVFQAPCKDPDPGIPVNERLVPCAEEAKILQSMVNDHETKRIVIANPAYNATKIQRFFLGQHYRDSWTQPIKVNVLNLDTEFGGLRPFQLGGGRQTMTLKLKAGNGLEYAFRSVDKDPSRGLRVHLRSTLLSVVLKDQTTTQQPYGALATNYLLDQTSILHPRPALFVMPDDPKLGPFQHAFGNMLGMLEERPTTADKGEETIYGADEIKRTIKMFRQLYKDKNNYIEIDEFIKARMFDIWVGDWGKHEDNWKWAGFKTDTGMKYRPIPRDRDHVFSLWDGFFPWLADREWAKESGESFEQEINDMRSLTWQSRHMDRFLANEMAKKDWLDAARYIQGTFSPEIIRAAIHKMPEEIIEADGNEIIEKLEIRIKDLEKYAAEYYALLAKEVDIPGSINDELFEVKRNTDGSVTVNMFELIDGEKGKQFYQRQFLPNETKEVRLFGMMGDDRFILDGKCDKSILVRVIPGTGVDYISDQSEVKKGKSKTIIYDDENVDPIIPGPETTLSNSPYPEAYHYRRTAFKYDSYFPLSFIYYTGDNGLSIKGGVTFTNQSYGKPEFSSIHDIEIGASTIGNVQFEYSGKWRHIIGRWDLTGGAKWEQRKRFRYFFGEGNATTFETERLRSGYYTLQYQTVKLNLGLINSFWKRSTTYAGISIESNTAQRNANTILDFDSANVLGKDALTIAKAQFELDLDFRDRKHLPTKGMRLYTNHFAGYLLNEEQSLYGMNLAELEYFGTSKPITLGLRAGGMIHHGRFPYYDRMYIGQNTHLRGFRRNRFTGEKMLYFNSDLRIELINKQNAIIPYQLGLKLFFDTGKVIVDESSSNIWHSGYGAGLYFVPVKERYVFNFMFGFSPEESGLFILSVGKDF